MYRKEEIRLVSSPVLYLRYILATSNVQAFLYDSATHTDIQEMERVATLTVSLFNNQFAVDEDKASVFNAPSIVGKYVRFVYYSEGEENPFYASSNLHSFITQVLRWTSNRVSEGIYLTTKECDCAYLRNIEPGSFVYENRFCVYPGEDFDVRLKSPPTIKEQFKAYYLFINQEIVETFLDQQEQILTKLGCITSSAMHDDTGSAKLDVLALYTAMYNSTPIQIAFVYIRLTESFSYDIWVEYPSSSRTL
jgi:hypothetical protein